MITTAICFSLFQSTPPGWEATFQLIMPVRINPISIHASRVGGDAGLQKTARGRSTFQSTPPGWEATGYTTVPAVDDEGFQSTPPGWEATFRRALRCSVFFISIHASRVGGDAAVISCRAGFFGYFNPRLPGGRRPSISAQLSATAHFNPRLPGGRRPRQTLYRSCMAYFNPRLPGGRRHSTILHTYSKFAISIHASRVGGDIPALGFVVGLSHFNPRLPGGRRHRASPSPSPPINFNPRLPGGRRPTCDRQTDLTAADFNPRLPGGRRHVISTTVSESFIFQSTPPGWEATLAARQKLRILKISIHASRVGGDTLPEIVQRVDHLISIHASRVGGDPLSPSGNENSSPFQSTPPGWEATPCRE